MVHDRSISEDWSEVDEVASVVSFSSYDEDFVSHHSRPSSPLVSLPTPQHEQQKEKQHQDEHHQEQQQQQQEHQPQLSDSFTTTTDLPFRPISPDLRPLSESETAPPDSLLIDLNHSARVTRDEPTPQSDTNATKNTTENGDSDTINTIDPINIDKGKQVDTIDDQKSDTSFTDTSDPNTYLRLLCAAINLLEETSDQAVRLGALRISTLSFLKSTCDELHKHTGELKPILAVYVRRWKDGTVEMDQSDMPLNPSLLEWISQLRSQLLNAQNVMDMIPLVGKTKYGTPTSGLSAASIPLHTNVALAGCAEALEDTLGTIEDFMPIFKMDFDEAQTRRMMIPTKPVGEQTTEPRREGPHPDVARIRQELYLLKDQIRQMTALLSGLCLLAKTATAFIDGQETVRRLNDLTEAISIILTNHASEWLECGMPAARNTIAYDEFLELDPEVLYDVANHVGELYRELVVDDVDMVDGCTPEMIRNHQTVMLMECGKLQELSSIADLLETWVTTRHKPPRAEGMYKEYVFE